MKPSDVNGCVFCEKIAKESLVHYGKAVVFTPLNPVTKRHLLVVPIKHATRLSEMTMDAKAHLFNALSIATIKLDSYNIINSCGENATQTVDHLHFHIVPRTKNDDLKLPWTEQATDFGESVNAGEVTDMLFGQAMEFAKNCGTEALGAANKQKLAHLYIDFAKQKGWISDSGKPTKPCPNCGRVYTGKYNPKTLGIDAIEVKPATPHSGDWLTELLKYVVLGEGAIELSPSVKERADKAAAQILSKHKLEVLEVIGKNEKETSWSAAARNELRVKQRAKFAELENERSKVEGASDVSS